MLATDFYIAYYFNASVQAAKVNAEKKLRVSGQWDGLSQEDQRLVEKMMLEGKRNGLTLSEEARTELAALTEEITNVAIEFDVRLLSCFGLTYPLTIYCSAKIQ